MASNAAVEKLKQFGLRHGEKAVVGVMTAVCLLCIGYAWSRPSIDITPDQLKKTAEAAASNINRDQKIEDILAKLDDAKLVDPGFEKKVDEAKPEADISSKVELYAFSGPSWASPEPGAGLIRDMPELLAPYDLHLNPNRGAVLMYARKADTGEIEFEDPTANQPKKVKKRRAKRGGMMGGGMMGGGMGGGRGKTSKKKGPSKAELERQERERIEMENARLKEALQGEGELKTAEEKEEAAGNLQAKEITKGFRCVAILGKLDHQKLKSNYVRALKEPNADPHYLRLDLQRQELGDDGEWTEWEDVDRDANQEVISNTLEKEEELTEDQYRLPGLVDDLPFFKAGMWRGVHIAAFVPEEKKTLAKLPDSKKKSGGPGGRMGGMGGMGGMMGPGEMGSSSGSMDNRMAGGAAGKMGGRMPGGRGGMMGGGMMDEGMMGGGMMGRGAMGGRSGGGRGPADTNYARSEAKTLMVRALDFTVEPDATYRYRVRIVVRNPNYGWETVAPGVDKDSEEKTGPWSDPTDPVSMPDDVSAYAYKTAPDSKTGEKITFQVARWNEDDGVTVMRTFDVEPGQVVGSKKSAYVPAPDGKGTKAVPIDFTSHQLVLDTKGGVRPLSLPDVRSRFEAPALAVLLRADGALVIRDEARDHANPEMNQLRSLAKQIIDDANANKKKKSGGAMGGMMGGGMMGGGGMRGSR